MKKIAKSAFTAASIALCLSGEPVFAEEVNRLHEKKGAATSHNARESRPVAAEQSRRAGIVFAGAASFIGGATLVGALVAFRRRQDIEIKQQGLIPPGRHVKHKHNYLGIHF